MKPASRRWSSDEKTELDRLLDAGKEAAEIAVALNRTRQAIYARLQRLYRKGAREAKTEWLKAK
jgi:IS30 family transposase